MSQQMSDRDDTCTKHIEILMNLCVHVQGNKYVHIYGTKINLINPVLLYLLHKLTSLSFKPNNNTSSISVSLIALLSPPSSS